MKRRIKLLSKSLLLLFLVFGLSMNFSIASQSKLNEKEIRQQEIEVAGIVTDAQTGDPLPGVNIVVEGTNIGTTTDMDGSYTIEAPQDASLVFSFVGYQEQTININGRQNIDVELAASVEELEEVVVTGLGISRDKKALGYSVGQVSGDEASDVGRDNVVNSLAGRVSGVSVSSTNKAPGASVSIVVRGATSLAGDNQPLFVVDGTPVNNSLSSNFQEMGSRNYVDYGNAISDINPEDIESISILKGPSAAALYGSRAADGVVQITTKKGERNTEINVDFTSSVELDNPYQHYQSHNKFATGTRTSPPPGVDVPRIPEGSAYSIGLPLDEGIEAEQYDPKTESWVVEELKSYPDNFLNFVQTGVATNNNLSIHGGTEKSNYRVSLTNRTNKGVVPNSDFYRTGINMSGSYDILENLTINSNVNVGRSKSNDRPAQNRGANPLQYVAQFSQHQDITDLKDYWSEGQEDIQQRQIPGHNNPYFLAHAVTNGFSRDRIFGNVELDWQITPEFSLMGKMTTDRYSEERETKIPWSYERDKKGFYGIQNVNKSENNAEFRATYDKGFGDISFNASVGGNLMSRHNTFNESKSTAGVTVPGLYNLSNVKPLGLQYSNRIYRKAIYSVYGKASIGYRDMAYLDITGRNDWSSTLPEQNNSYFYPSASLSLLLNNMFELPGSISLLKLRGGWAQVGSDTDPYQLQATLHNPGSWGSAPRLSTPSGLQLPDLKPEIATSTEFGGDVALFDNKLRFDATYFVQEKENQILSINLPMSSGYSSKFINAGLVESKGWEAGFGITPVRSNNLNWNLDFNFTRQRTTIQELAEGVPYYQLWSSAKARALAYVGDQIGTIYDRRVKRVQDESSEYYGWPLLGDDGWYQDVSGDPSEMKPVGNFNPDFQLGMQSSVSYKNFSFSFSLDWRKGGDFISQTYRYTSSDWRGKYYMETLIDPRGIDNLPEHLRSNPEKYIMDIQKVGGPTEEMGGLHITGEGDFYEGYDGTFNTGVRGEYDEDGNLIGYIENLGDPEKTKFIPAGSNYAWSFARASMAPADYIKLREVTLSYQIPLNQVFESLRVSLYTHNIILWTKADIHVDPENAFQPEDGRLMQGIERYNVSPFTIPVGIKVNVGF